MSTFTLETCINKNYIFKGVPGDCKVLFDLGGSYTGNSWEFNSQYADEVVMLMRILNEVEIDEENLYFNFDEPAECRLYGVSKDSVVIGEYGGMFRLYNDDEFSDEGYWVFYKEDEHIVAQIFDIINVKLNVENAAEEKKRVLEMQNGRDLAMKNSTRDGGYDSEQEDQDDAYFDYLDELYRNKHTASLVRNGIIDLIRKAETHIDNLDNDKTCCEAVKSVGSMLSFSMMLNIFFFLVIGTMTLDGYLGHNTCQIIRNWFSTWFYAAVSTSFSVESMPDMVHDDVYVNFSNLY